MSKNKILKATALVFFLSLLSKIIGFAKSIIQASYFGATYQTDAFNISNGFVSNILYMLTMAIAVAFVPLYTQHKQKSKEEGERFATRIATFMFLGAIIVTLILIVIAPVILRIIAPSYDKTMIVLSTKYFRVLVLGFAFSLVANIYLNLLNAERVYGFSAFSSILNSCVLILCIVLLSNSLGVWSLVISVPASYFAQWIMLYSKGRRYAKLSLRFGIRDEGIKLLIKQATPVLISQATVEINQVIDRALLTGVGEGALTAVSYAAILYQFATTLISVPLSTVMFTELSEAGAKADLAEIKRIIRLCYKVISIVCIPVVLIMFVCSTDIVNIVYNHGKYSQEALSQTSIALQMYGLCLFPVCLKTILSRAYYSTNDTKRPMIIGILEVVLNISLSILLVRYYGIKGVVGATAIASFTMIVVMIIDYNIKHIKVLDRKELFSFWKIILCSLVLLVVVYGISKFEFASSLVDFMVKSLIAFCVFFSSLLLLKEQTIKMLFNKLGSGAKK